MAQKLGCNSMGVRGCGLKTLWKWATKFSFSLKILFGAYNFIIKSSTRSSIIFKKPRKITNDFFNHYLFVRTFQWNVHSDDIQWNVRKNIQWLGKSLLIFLGIVKMIKLLVILFLYFRHLLCGSKNCKIYRVLHWYAWLVKIL